VPVVESNLPGSRPTYASIANDLMEQGQGVSNARDDCRINLDRRAPWFPKDERCLDDNFASTAESKK
jgi:hypothetical protein